MATDDFKKYVDQNRESFEIYEYESEGWDGIESKLDYLKKEKTHVRVPTRYLWRVAAAVVLSFGFVLYLLWTNMNQMSFNPELADIEVYYQEMIAVKVSQISALDADQEIFQDIEILDEAFVELKHDLRDNADNAEVVNAMISNYKVKLEILERILDNLQKENER